MARGTEALLVVALDRLRSAECAKTQPFVLPAKSTDYVHWLCGVDGVLYAQIGFDERPHPMQYTWWSTRGGVMRYMAKTTMDLSEDDARPEAFPGHCYAEKNRSRAVEIVNQGTDRIQHISFAYYSAGDDFWNEPIEIAEEVLGGKNVSYDLRPRQLKIIECKIKFTSPDGTFTDSFLADQDLFIGCVGLITRRDGGFTTWWTQMALPGA